MIAQPTQHKDGAIRVMATIDPETGRCALVIKAPPRMNIPDATREYENEDQARQAYRDVIEASKKLADFEGFTMPEHTRRWLAGESFIDIARG